MLSALVLDNARFSNVQIENGKLVSDGTRTLALGYALPGMQESLSLPEELLGNDGFVFFFQQITIQLDDPGGEMKGFVQKNAVLCYLESLSLR